jgi:hypothetical protein
MQSTPPLKEANPHDVFAIESILAARADRAPPPASVGRPAVAPPVHAAPEISLNFSPGSSSSVGAPDPQVEPTFPATGIRDVEIENIRPDEIRVDELEALALGERPASKWGKGIAMALLGLCCAVGAAAWQHYGDQAKAMAADWAPPFVLAALAPSETPPSAEDAPAPAIEAAAANQQGASADQPAAEPATSAEPATPAEPEQAVAAPAAAVSSPESAQLQSMAQDLAAMGQQVEELKATIAALKASQAQMASEVAKANEARTAEVNPRVTAPAPRPAAAPPRRPKPKPATPAQAAYVPPSPPIPAPVVQQYAPPPPPRETMADDGVPVVRPPMPLR